MGKTGGRLLGISFAVCLCFGHQLLSVRSALCGISVRRQPPRTFPLSLHFSGRVCRRLLCPSAGGLCAGGSAECLPAAAESDCSADFVPTGFSTTREYCLKGATHLCSSVHSNPVPLFKSCVCSGAILAAVLLIALTLHPFESPVPVQPAAQHDTCVPNGLAQVRFLQSYGWEVKRTAL